MKIIKLDEAKFYGKNGDAHYKNHVLGVGGSGLYKVKFKETDGSITTKIVNIKLYNDRSVEDFLHRRYPDKTIEDSYEIFDKNNPKFPNMTKDDYYDAAEELSLAQYGDPGSNSDIIGFISTDKRGRDERAVKIRKVSKFNPDYSDLVIYIDDEGYNPGNAPVNTFMLAKRKRVEDELKKVNPNKKPTDFKEREH